MGRLVSMTLFLDGELVSLGSSETMPDPREFRYPQRGHCSGMMSPLLLCRQENGMAERLVDMKMSGHCPRAVSSRCLSLSPGGGRARMIAGFLGPAVVARFRTLMPGSSSEREMKLLVYCG
jgi:hypothetical protein